MEFLVEFEIDVPEGTAESDVEKLRSAEAAAAAVLAREGQLVRGLEAAGRAWGVEGPQPVPRGQRGAA
jgi:muconolactone delta-isomerase